jgi:Carbohydrate-selective porin, OprB family/S-layer homology domain
MCSVIHFQKIEHRTLHIVYKVLFLLIEISFVEPVYSFEIALPGLFQHRFNEKLARQILFLVCEESLMFSAFQANWNAQFVVRLWTCTLLFSAVGMMSGGRSQTAQAEEVDNLQSVSQISQQVNFDSPAAASVPAFTSNAPLIQSTGNSEAQVTSVSQLSDVQPTDWAFQALQSLVERYGCIAGYPDGTFRGNRAATRYELAAALNACLDQISDRFATKEDLATVKALQEEFKTELATLKGRVDGLEARTKTLEAQQFSTTTKLSGNAFFNITGATAGNGLLAEGVDGILPLSVFNNNNLLTNRVNGVPVTRTVNDDPNVTFSGLVWLGFNTSFTGKDLLRVQLASGTGNSPANAFASAGLFNTWGTPFTDQTAGVDSGTFVVRELNYSFPVAKNFDLVVGPRINFYRYFDNNRFTFFLNGSTSFDSIGSPLLNASKRGAGAIAIWSPSPKLQVKLGYLSQSIEFLPSFLNSAENSQFGLFDGTNTLTGEVSYSPVKTVNLRFLYTRTNLATVFGGLIGGTAGLPLYGLADDGFGGALRPATANTFGFNFDWLVTRGFGVFGRYTYGNTNLTPVDPTRPKGDVNNQSIQFGLAFPDLFKPGAQATLAFVVPSDVFEGGRKFLIAGGGVGGTRYATQYDIEASYFYPVNDNVALVPAFYAIINPNNISGNPTVFVGNLRMQFSF